jgi:hypothetical protein
MTLKHCNLLSGIIGNIGIISIIFREFLANLFNISVIDPNEFKSSVVEILRTNSHFEDLVSKLKAYLRRYNFPKMTDQSRNECKRCKAPVTALLQSKSSIIYKETTRRRRSR